MKLSWNCLLLCAASTVVACLAAYCRGDDGLVEYVATAKHETYRGPILQAILGPPRQSRQACVPGNCSILASQTQGQPYPQQRQQFQPPRQPIQKPGYYQPPQSTALAGRVSALESRLLSIEQQLANVVTSEQLAQLAQEVTANTSALATLAEMSNQLDIKIDHHFQSWNSVSGELNRRIDEASKAAEEVLQQIAARANENSAALQANQQQPESKHPADPPLDLVGLLLRAGVGGATLVTAGVLPLWAWLALRGGQAAIRRRIRRRRRRKERQRPAADRPTPDPQPRPSASDLPSRPVPPPRVPPPMPEPPRVVTTDAPPPPQQTIQTNHYVPYEQDSYRRAHDQAREQLARRYPSSVQYLESLERLISQYEAGG